KCRSVGLLRLEREAATIEDRRSVVVGVGSPIRVVDDAERRAFFARGVALEQFAEPGRADVPRARSAQAQAAADLVDAADLPADRLGRSLLGGVAVGGSVLAPPRRAVELEQLADRQVAEHRYVELAERLYHLDLAAVVEPEGEGVVGVIRDVAVGNVAAFAAVLGAGRSADRAGPSVEQRAVHADRRDVLVVDEVLDDRAIGIVDR